MSSDDVNRTLAALDAALAGEAVSAEDRPLGELATGLRELRPRPRPEFVRTLDARAAEGFAAPRARAPRPPLRRPAGAKGRAAAALVRRRTAFYGAGAALATLAVALIVVLAGTGGRTHAVTADRGGGASSAPAVAAPESSVARAAKGAQAQAAAGTPRQTERGSALEVGVSPDAIQSASQRVFTLVSALQGYVQQSNVNSGGADGSASFDIRVPSAKLSAAIAALSHIGHVRSETDNTNDVTGQYDSLQGSLAEARAERAGLLRSLAGGAEAEAALRARLRAVDARLASLQGQLRALKQRVGYSSLALTLTAEAKAGGAGAGSLTPGGAARDAGRILDAALAVLVLAGAAALPFAALALLAWVAFAAVRRRAREQALDAG